ncbi:MAG: PEP-CTERM sorting domain-containing protein [Verrucomicrobia bacterium]|nr:PEP-CTERM sorting domain-containing protein [Verrucomicrobiota bacterium]
MKKYITIAALLSAGTALANAEPEKLTLTSPSGNKVESGNAYTAWSNSGEGYSVLDSWSVSFSLTDSALSSAGVFSTTRKANGGFSGYVLKTKADGGIELTNTSISLAGILTAGQKSDLITVSFVADVLEDGTFSGGTFTVSSGDKSSSEKVSGLTTDSYPTETNGATGLINGEQTFGNTKWSSRFWTNGGAEKIYDISISKLDSNVIPEPSAFGMLAGLGALALVASRRRRK